MKFQDIKDVNDNIIELSNAFYEFTKAFGNGKPKAEVKEVQDNGHKEVPVKDNSSYAEAMSQIANTTLNNVKTLLEGGNIPPQAALNLW